MLFLIKRTSLFENKETYKVNNQTAGLAYNATIGNLVEKDTDGDGIPDWQESLYGLDPTKKETVPGIPDITTFNKLRAEQGASILSQDSENLTETDKFARELFATTTSLSQNGVVNQETADKIGISLAERIKNIVVRKVFLSSDLKVIEDNSKQAVKTYRDAMLNIRNTPDKGTIVGVLQKFIIDKNNVDVSTLAELDPIIEQTQNVIKAMLETAVPSSLAQLHLDFINASEKIMENVIDLKSYESDPVVAMGAMSKYVENINLFQTILASIVQTVNQKLNS